MKDLLKIGGSLALLFASTFIILRALGVLQEDQVRAYVTALGSTAPWMIAIIVILLLWLDLLVAVPTMTTILLAGFFLGPWLGSATSVVGLMLMGSSGYVLGRYFGRPVVSKLIGDGPRIHEIEASFARNDLLVLFVCQALPIMPEVCACLAGLNKMNFRRFLFGFAVGVVPFAIVVAVAGSFSSASNPTPAVLTAIGTSTFLLLCWRALRKQ